MKGPLWQISLTTSVEAEEAVAVIFENSSAGSPRFPDAATQRPLFRPIARNCHCAKLHCARVCGPLCKSPKQRPEHRLWQEITDSNSRARELEGVLEKAFQTVRGQPHPVDQASWSGRRPRAGQAVVVLDPGLSFGTGQQSDHGVLSRQLAGRRYPDSTVFPGIGTAPESWPLPRQGWVTRRSRRLDFDAGRRSRSPGECNSKTSRQADPHLSGRHPFLPHSRWVKFDVICANLTSDLLVSRLNACAAAPAHRTFILAASSRYNLSKCIRLTLPQS